MDNVLTTIHHYAVRKEILYANLLPLIKHAQSYDLMKRLHDDFCNIPMAVSALEDIQLDLIVKLLETMMACLG